jgi:hypothetical protein
VAAARRASGINFVGFDSASELQTGAALAGQN